MKLDSFFKFREKKINVVSNEKYYLPKYDCNL